MTETEQEELETLRNEKRIRLQTARAEKALGEAKLPASFASLLVGADNAETGTARHLPHPVRRRAWN